ncbi:MAG: diaminobutyrate--2-oxoglutarate transaminase [Pseudomonadota bacterium]
MNAELFETMEAEVRSYCRNFPAIFSSGRNATLTDVNGGTYIDFLAGAGTLNYGHNHPIIREAVINYMLGDGVAHALDMHTVAKHDFLAALKEVILRPRGLDYKVTFPGPTGTNAVETAFKYARRATGRQNIIAFTNGFHGMTLGALAASATRGKRMGASVPLTNVMRAPFEGYLDDMDTASYLDKLLSDSGSGVDLPAAIIVETIQAEGGLNTASADWLRRIAAIARQHGVLLIVDDIQAGCGRSGSFFSFDDMGFTPDMVCLSKAIGGMGLPMALLLLRPDLDVLKPGEHNGTFRGNNLAFVAAKTALELWRDPNFGSKLAEKSKTLHDRLSKIASRYSDEGAHVRGRGLMLGLGWDDPGIAARVSRAAFRRGVIAETTGSDDQVLKLLPPLTISDQELHRGLEGIEAAIDEVMARESGGSTLQAAE